MATFPDYAVVLLAGYGEEADYGVLRTEMDGGIAKQRPTRTKPVVPRDAQIMVESKADSILFDKWADEELNYRTGWFSWLDPRSETIKQARIVGGKYRWTCPGVIWLAQCQLETLG